MLNGKNKDDLAPITTFILLFATPFQIIFLFFFVTPECHMAGSNPKNSINFILNCSESPISGNKIKPWKPFLIKFFKLSK